MHYDKLSTGTLFEILQFCVAVEKKRKQSVDFSALESIYLRRNTLYKWIKMLAFSKISYTYIIVIAVCV